MIPRWPTGFASLDGGRLLVNPSWLDLLPWRSLDDVMNADVNVVRRVGNRDNCRIDLAGKATYLKRHWHPRAGWLSQRPPGLWEADAVGWCQDADVPTMEIVAAGGDAKQSFFLSRAIDGIPADDWWKANPNRSERERVMVALAETARRFHAAGLFHRDFYWCHFFVSSFEQTSHLIDLQRVVRKPWFEWRWRIKDLGQFWYSAPEGVTDDDRNEWFAVYTQGAGAKAVERAALIRAGFYRLKEGRAA
jgi:heptose I phosphotransferase